MQVPGPCHVSRVVDSDDLTNARRDLLEHLQPLAAEWVLEAGETGDVSSWLRQALDESLADRIDDQREHDRYCGGLLAQCSQYLRAVGQDHVRCHTDELSSIFLDEVRIGGAKAIVDMDIAAGHPAQRLKTPVESCDASLRLRIGFNGSNQHSDSPHPLALLRTRCDRPRRCRAPKKQYELAPFHSITSSATASSLSGTVSPSARAVLRLMTSSNLVGCSIGSSAGAVPLRMRAT